MQAENHSLLISIDSILEEKMLTIRNEKVLLDTDIANLFQITTPQLHRKVRENIERFPKQFMFKISAEELRKISPLALPKRRNIYAFTWGGIMMAAGQIRSKRANEISVQLVRHYGKGINFELLQKNFKEIEK